MYWVIRNYSRVEFSAMTWYFSKFFNLLHGRSPEEVQRYRREKEITVAGKDVPNPIMQFDEINFPNFIIQEIK